MPFSVLRRTRKRQRTEAARESPSPSPCPSGGSMEIMTINSGSIVSDSEQAPPRRFLSLTSPFASSATQRPATPFLWRRSPVGRNGSELERHMDDLNRELQQDVEDTDSRDALTRLTDLSRDYARLEVYYEEVHRRYSEAKGEIGRLREEVNVLEGTLAARERRIKTLKQALKVRRH